MKIRYLVELVRQFSSDQSGNIVIIAALALPVVIGFSALSVEYGSGLLTRSENQRVADLASYAGALAYGSTKSEDRMIEAARSIAELNGISADDVSIALVPSPRDPASQAVYATVTTTNKLMLATILGAAPDLPVTAASYASFGSAGESCMLALDNGGSGITLSGGVRLNAPECQVASNASITAPCGTHITAKAASYDSGSPDTCRWSSNVVDSSGNALPIKKEHIADPLEGSAAVASLVSRFDVIRAKTSPFALSVPNGVDLNFGGMSPSDLAARIVALGCTYDSAYYNQWWTNTWVISCPVSASPVNVGNLTVGGGIGVWFNTTGDSRITYNFSGRIQNSGTSLAFGNGTFNVAKGISGQTLSFGSGSFTIGKGESWCGDGYYSICNSGTMTFGGSSSFVLEAGFYNGGGSKLTLGSGSGNSYIFGPSSTGKGIAVSGGSKTYMGDVTGGSGVFEIYGHVDGGGGGSCIIFPAAPQHDIMGNVFLGGAATLGAGIYTVDGYFVVDTGGANCDGTNGIYGVDVTIVISGKQTASAGSCKGQAFCVSAGNSITLTAPSSGDNASLAVIGPQSPDNHAGAEISSGGKGKVSGAFYFPNGPIEMSGGARLGDGPSDCLQMIGSSITLSGGTGGASACKGLAGSGVKIALVQ